MTIPFHLENVQADLAASSHEAEFLHALGEAYRDIFVCVLSIVGNRTDADDVMQEVCAVLWQKFAEFDPERNFRKWATGYAFNVAKSYARQKRRRAGYGLSEQMLAKIAFVQSAGSELFELRRDLLLECLARLQSRDQRFLMDCYAKSTTLAVYAQGHNIPVTTVYTRLKRLRKRLVDCVNRGLGREAPDGA